MMNSVPRWRQSLAVPLTESDLTLLETLARLLDSATDKRARSLLGDARACACAGNAAAALALMHEAQRTATARAR